MLFHTLRHNYEIASPKSQQNFVGLVAGIIKWYKRHLLSELCRLSSACPQPAWHFGSHKFLRQKCLQIDNLCEHVETKMSSWNLSGLLCLCHLMPSSKSDLAFFAFKLPDLHHNALDLFLCQAENVQWLRQCPELCGSMRPTYRPRLRRGFFVLISAGCQSCCAYTATNSGWTGAITSMLLYTQGCCHHTRLQPEHWRSLEMYSTATLPSFQWTRVSVWAACACLQLE